MTDKSYMSVVSSQKNNVIFENQTTACVIRIAVEDKDIWLDYSEFESLCDVIDNVRSIGEKLKPKNSD